MNLPTSPPEDFVSYLGEGMHTTFRKGTDAPQAMTIHRLIDEMPDEDWHNAVYFVADAMWQFIRNRVENEAG